MRASFFYGFQGEIWDLIVINFVHAFHLNENRALAGPLEQKASVYNATLFSMENTWGIVESIRDNGPSSFQEMLTNSTKYRLN